jgi:hypothetical protein
MIMEGVALQPAHSFYRALRPSEAPVPIPWGSDDLDVGEFVVDDGLGWEVQVGFDSLEGRPAADLHDHARVDVLVGQQS